MHTQPHDLSGAQLELVDLVASRQDRHRRAVAQHRLDADLEAEPRDALDERRADATAAIKMRWSREAVPGAKRNVAARCSGLSSATCAPSAATRSRRYCAPPSLTTGSRGDDDDACRTPSRTQIAKGTQITVRAAGDTPGPSASGCVGASGARVTDRVS